MRLITTSLLCLLFSLTCQAADPRFTVIPVDTTTEELQLYLRDDKDRGFKQFDRLKTWLAGQGKELRFAMNAGMYHADYSPVGLYVQQGQQLTPLNLGDAYGNFFLKPNGVFLLTQSGPMVVESSEYPPLAAKTILATQSGPLLLRKGVIHPAFKENSTSRLKRNGVGVVGNKALFVITEQPVNLYEMAQFFRDELHCQDALYLDGNISGIYSTELNRNDATVDLGPIIAVVQATTDAK
ncbi:phosphodiester glycosidase family protein [Undibacterium sp. TS12]|uniref:phosphodiester glycosidase family protein n=1 Tax=Undibacterium sp. TS12 TaxID=2908202 RepID=UPI001F4CA5B8|nr:phosphodiester glycosidase family protein [Undibacterium sp. TS12]MCH8622345.1 phosphodiester glycosidase family protein [Undibacterium sp. TS12]